VDSSGRDSVYHDLHVRNHGRTRNFVEWIASGIEGYQHATFARCGSVCLPEVFYLGSLRARQNIRGDSNAIRQGSSTGMDETFWFPRHASGIRLGFYRYVATGWFRMSLAEFALTRCLFFLPLCRHRIRRGPPTCKHMCPPLRRSLFAKSLPLVF